MSTAILTIHDLLRVACLAALLVAGGCAVDAAVESAPGGAPPDLASLGERLEALDRELGPGSRGEDVRAVHAYLLRFGYFPNPELAQRYPSWRPMLADPPAAWDVFDEQTGEAIRELQAMTGLLETGLVDAATRAMLLQPRCGVPDSAPADPSEKWSHTGRGWLGSTTIKWRLVTTDDGIPLASARTAVANALRSWSALTNLTFVEAQNDTGLDVLQIAFKELLAGPSNDFALALTDYPDHGHKMDIDTDDKWSVATPTPGGTADLETIVLHEIGHALGMDHAPPPATMRAVQSLGAQDRTLAYDDRVGVSARYDGWELKPGCGKGIGVGSDGPWVLGCIQSAGGYSIHKWSGSDWLYDTTNMRATQITVAGSGLPWVVNDQNQIFRRTSTDPASGGWQLLPGCARDIGASVAGQEFVWIVNCDQRAAKWDGSTWVTDTTNMPAFFIDVAQGGVPFLLSTSGATYRRTSTSPTTGSWARMPSAALALGVGPAAYPWALSGPINSLGLTPYVWNEQPANGPGEPGHAEWYRFNAGLTGVDIDVEMDGRPWMVDNAGFIWRQAK